MEPRFYAHFREAGRRQAWPVPDAHDPRSAASRFLATHPIANPEIGRVAITVIDQALAEQHCFEINLTSGEATPCD